MFAEIGFHILLLALTWPGSEMDARELKCPPLRSPSRGVLFFSLEGEVLRCARRKCPVGAVAHISCEEFYEGEANGTCRCLPNGLWSLPTPKCIPVCGKANSEVSLIVNGMTVSPGAFPWQVAIYNAVEGKHEFWCGGSLISERAVLTAAHCTWKTNSKNLLLAFGKFRREIHSEEFNAQVMEAKRIEVLESYQDASGNYNGDISVIFLKDSVRFDRFVRPICLDWNQEYVDEHLREGTLGTVLGWGLTENDTFSDRLRILKLPVASDEKCIAEQERDFRKFVTYTSFCAGFGNGTGVCNGDSGGGLAFLEKKTDVWYLQGLVSVSPRRKGTPYCDPHFYTVFTKVSLFTKWLKKLEIFEGGTAKEESVPASIQSEMDKTWEQNRDPYKLVRKYFDKVDSERIDKKVGLHFPHSKKIVESARLLNR